MATVTEMRAWLRDQGHDVPARGRLDASLIKAYEDAHDTGLPAPEDDGWDLAGDDSMADPDDLEPSVPLQPERAPRTARAARAERRSQPVGQRTSRLLGALRGDQKTGKPGPKKKAPPRTSLEKFTTRAYTSLGRIVGNLAPATGNCLQAQAAMAGVLLEDVVAHTAIDRLLQPAARAEDKLDKIAALVLPPVIVFGMEMNQAAAAQGARTPQQAMARQAILMPMLRESLRVGLDVSESFADQIAARLKRNAEQEQEIDKLIQVIFGQVQAEAEAEPEMAGAAA